MSQRQDSSKGKRPGARLPHISQLQAPSQTNQPNQPERSDQRNPPNQSDQSIQSIRWELLDRMKPKAPVQPRQMTSVDRTKPKVPSRLSNQVSQSSSSSECDELIPPKSKLAPLSPSKISSTERLDPFASIDTLNKFQRLVDRADKSHKTKPPSLRSKTQSPPQFTNDEKDLLKESTRLLAVVHLWDSLDGIQAVNEFWAATTREGPKDPTQHDQFLKNIAQQRRVRDELYSQITGNNTFKRYNDFFHWTLYDHAYKMYCDIWPKHLECVIKGNDKAEWDRHFELPAALLNSLDPEDADVSPLSREEMQSIANLG